MCLLRRCPHCLRPRIPRYDGFVGLVVMREVVVVGVFGCFGDNDG